MHACRACGRWLLLLLLLLLLCTSSFAGNIESHQTNSPLAGGPMGGGGRPTLVEHVVAGVAADP